MQPSGYMLKESFFLFGLKSMKVHNLKDDLVLLIKKDDTKISKVVEEDNEWQ